MIQKVQAENNDFKTRLFDSLETEKRLRSQLGGKAIDISSPIGGSGGGGGAANAAKLAQYETEIKSLKAQLETKEHENKELVAICDELLKECETLKANAAAAAVGGAGDAAATGGDEKHPDAVDEPQVDADGNPIEITAGDEPAPDE